MAIQFAGSSSTGDRRRRRLAVNGDGTDVDPSLLDGDRAEMESELVASAAAAPWVPVNETRIWIYAGLIGLLLGGLTFAHIRPYSFQAELMPIADHLFAGSRPAILVVAQTVFLTLSAQLGMLIGWYRSRGRLDFGGRYRVWPWAVTLFGMVAFCAATNFHQTVGAVARQSAFLQWRGHVVAWLLPLCAAALPITLLLDRDMRNSRSSLYMFRLSVCFWLVGAWLEVYQVDLAASAWLILVRQLLPVFASATLFLGLWLHARIVAYVCPDPPELEEQSAGATMLGAIKWLTRRLLFWKKKTAAETEEDDAKPKRRRKKVEGEEATTKRKRKAPTKKTTTTTRTRTRAKPAEEEVEESSDESTSYEPEASSAANEYADESSYQETSASDDDQSQNEEAWEQPPEREKDRTSASAPRRDGRFTEVHQSHAAPVPAPHARRQAPIQAPAPVEEVSAQVDEPSEETDEDRQFQMDSGMTADQMKGMSKRQKRELRKQMRDQERARGR